MSNPHHVVNEFLFEVEFSSMEQASADQNTLVELIKTELAQRARNIFDHKDSHGQTLRFDKLVLDLGEVNHHSMRNDIVERFSEQMNQALITSSDRTNIKQAGGVATRPSLAVSAENAEGMVEASTVVPLHVISNEESKLQQLLYFLSTGSLSWQTILPTTRHFDQFLLATLSEQGAVLGTHLQGGSILMLDRLISHLPERERHRVFSLTGDTMQDRTSVLKKVLNQQIDLNSYSRRVQRRVWVAITKILLSTPGLEWGEKQIVELLSEVAKSKQVEWRGFLDSLPLHQHNGHSDRDESNLSLSTQRIKILDINNQLVAPVYPKDAIKLRTALFQLSPNEQSILLHKLVSKPGRVVSILEYEVEKLMDSFRISAEVEKNIWSETLFELYSLPSRGISLERLIDAVSKSLRSHNIKPESLDKLRELTQCELANIALLPNESLVDFLKCGSRKVINDSWSKLMRDRQEELLSAIKVILNRKSDRTGLISCLSVNQLKDLAILLVPEYSSHLNLLIDVLSEGIDAFLTEAEANKFSRRLLWGSSLSHLVVHSDQQVNLRGCIESVAKQLARDHNLSYLRVLKSTSSALLKRATDHSFGVTLDAVINKAIQSQARLDSRNSLKKSKHRFAKSGQVDLHQNYSTGLTQPLDVHQLKDILESREITLPEFLKRIVNHQKRDQTVEQNQASASVSTLSVGQIRDISRLLAPRFSSYLGRLIDALLENLNKASATPHRSKEPRHFLWSVGLTSFALMDQHRIDIQSCTEQVVRQFSRYHGLSYPQVLVDITNTISKTESNSVLEKELATTMQDSIRQSESLSARPTIENIESRLKSFSQLDSLRDYCAARTGSLDDQRLEGILKKYHITSPAYFKRLVREIECDLGVGQNTKESVEQYALVLIRSMRDKNYSLGTGILGNSSPVKLYRENAADKRLPNNSGETLLPATQPNAKDMVSHKTSILQSILDDSDGLITEKSDHANKRSANESEYAALSLLQSLCLRWPEHVRRLFSPNNHQYGPRKRDLNYEIGLDKLLTEIKSVNITLETTLSSVLKNIGNDHGLKVSQIEHSLATLLEVSKNAVEDFNPLLTPKWLGAIILLGKNDSSYLDKAEQNRMERAVLVVDSGIQAFQENDVTQLFEYEDTTLFLVNSLTEGSLAKLLAERVADDYTEIRALTETVYAAALFNTSYLNSIAIRRLLWFGVFDWFIGKGQTFSTPGLAKHLVTEVYKVIRREDSSAFTKRLHARLPKATRSSLWLMNLEENLAGNCNERAHQKNMLGHEKIPIQSPPQVMAEYGDLAEFKELNLNMPQYLSNAGVVLLAPYLPRLFESLDLTKAGKFTSDTDAEHAAHLIHFIVNDQTDAPEYELVLNKVLCGIPLDRPLQREYSVSESERELISSLLHAVIGHWEAIGQTSPQGFRESFLLREGTLALNESGWQVIVAEQSYDMLLDRLPWSFRLIKFPWMESALHVQWR